MSETTASKKESLRNKNVQTLASSLAGLIGSSVGKTVLHPIDTVKAKLQVQQVSNKDRG